MRRALLDDEGVSFQCLKTWKQSRDPGYEAKKNRILYLYGLMDGTDHTSHAGQAGMIRRYIAWRNQNAHDQRRREIVNRANAA